MSNSISGAFAALRADLRAELAASRELSCALTKLDEAEMWAERAPSLIAPIFPDGGQGVSMAFPEAVGIAKLGDEG